ncbi:MAG: hypothetical protein E6F99_29240 [Actinobacteria bacterium]|nr:MAG: hypothetical protein E6F99_29240 [Actinomycetota bacterium]
MANMRRRDPEPPPGPPRIEFKPGMANDLLRELAPLLAEEGVDVDNIDVPDMQTLQRAMNRATERHNMALFTPVGDTRELAVATLRLIVEALTDDDTNLATAILDQVAPESPDNSAPTVSACIGITLGLLDDWLGGHDPTTPTRLGDRVRLPKGHWLGERAARDILALAGKGQAFLSLGPLIARQGGQHVLYGSALALTAAIRTWSNETGTPVPQLARTAIR